jgi:hypothetical protein
VKTLVFEAMRYPLSLVTGEAALVLFRRARGHAGWYTGMGLSPALVSAD